MNDRGCQAERVRNHGSAAERVDDVVCCGHDDNVAQIAESVKAKTALTFVESSKGLAHIFPIFSTSELLEALDVKLGRGKGRAVSECLGLDSAAATRLFSGQRALKLDEAKKLVETFNLENAPSRGVGPLTIPVARLVILYAFDYMGAPVSPDDPRVEELAQDIRAFSKFSLDPEIRENPVAANGFFQGMRQSRDPIA